MDLSRRDILQLGLLGGSAFFLPFSNQKPAHASFLSPQIPRFEKDLPIPPELSPTYSDETTDYYEI